MASLRLRRHELVVSVATLVLRLPLFDVLYLRRRRRHFYFRACGLDLHQELTFGAGWPLIFLLLLGVCTHLCLSILCVPVVWCMILVSR